MTVLRLKKREDRRVLAGHLWLFSNEIDTSVTPLKALEPGQAVTIESAAGKFLAHGYANPHSLIAARVTSHRGGRPFDATLLRARLESALALRTARYDAPYYRWVFGEGDGLPGLVVDRYDQTLIVQITTAGMEQWRDEVLDALQHLSGATAICLANDVSMRELEHLPLERSWPVGAAPDHLQIVENELSFTAPTESGQKTGWFYDHRDSRKALRDWVRGRRVLDLYSYLGAFGINAAASGAREVLAIDSSAAAVAGAEANAAANGVGDRFEARVGDVVDTLRALFEADERFDVIVLDPPAFIKRKKDREAGLRHYGLNNRLAMRLLTPNGILLSASCSQALDGDTLQQLVRQSLPKGSEGMQVLAPLQQAADHPVNLAMPETLYLKGLIGRLR